MSKESNPSGGTWTSREAYLLALVCLMLGLVVGYMFRGSAAVPGAVPVTTAGVTPPAGASPAPSAPPTAESLQPLAAPLLAALKADPKNADTLVQLGNLYYDNHVYPQAIEYYTRALELRPNDPNVRTDLGTAFWYSGFAEKAVAEYQKSLAANPTHANTLFNVGVVRS
ncbi:MAG: tetratricopeptide repeat protein, partial [Acidobacteria bacterium]|nr:tetratricopeptide repeat protein [Acidobacteriota bacterium]